MDVESAHGGGEGDDDGAEGQQKEADVGHEAAADQHLDILSELTSEVLRPIEIYRV